MVKCKMNPILSNNTVVGEYKQSIKISNCIRYIGKPPHWQLQTAYLTCKLTNETLSNISQRPLDPHCEIDIEK